MIDTILVFFGTIFLTYGLMLSFKIQKDMINYDAKSKWVWISCLICFFILGYLLFLAELAIYSFRLQFSNEIVALVFFFGSIFVVSILNQSKQSFEKMKAKNMELEEITKHLTHSQKKLQDTETLLEDKNKQMESLLEDFYTLRMTLDKKTTRSRIRKENKQMRVKLDKIKSFRK